MNSEVFSQIDLTEIRKLLGSHHKTAMELKKLYSYLILTCCNQELFDVFKRHEIKTHEIERMCKHVKYDFISKRETLCIQGTLDDTYQYYILSGELGLLKNSKNFDKHEIKPKLNKIDSTENLRVNLVSLQKSKENRPFQELKEGTQTLRKKKGILKINVGLNFGLETFKMGQNSKRLIPQVSVFNDLFLKKKPNCLFENNESKKMKPNSKFPNHKSSNFFMNYLKESNMFERKTKLDQQIFHEFQSIYLEDHQSLEEKFLVSILNEYGPLVRTFSSNSFLDSQKIQTDIDTPYTIFAIKNSEMIRINKFKIKRFMTDVYLERFSKIKTLLSKALYLSPLYFSAIIDNLSMETKVT